MLKSTLISRGMIKLRKWLLTIGPVLKKVSVEPAALLLMTSTLMSYLVFQDFIMGRICLVDLNLGREVCDAVAKGNESYREEELQVQEIAAKIRSYRSLISYTFPILFVLFIGTWSDIYGRKLPMLLGISTTIIQDTMFIIFAYYESVGGMWIGLLPNVVQCFSGSGVSFSMAAFSYISDATDKSARTIRIGLLSAGYHLGVPMGFAFGGMLGRYNFGHTNSFIISASFAVAAFLIVLFRVKNTRPIVDKPENARRDEDGNCKHIMNKLKGICKDIVAVGFKKREDNGRRKIWLLLVIYICVAAPIHGEFGVMYMFLRTQLGWDAGDYGYFAMYSSVTGVAGLVMSMGILSSWLALSDPWVGFLAGLSQFSACFVYAFARSTTSMYLAPAIDMMNGTMHVVAKSMMSKLVDKEEYGKLFTFIAVITFLVPLGMDPLYSTIYRLTLHTFPGTFFFFSAALTVPAQLLYVYFIGQEWHDTHRRGYIDAFEGSNAKESYNLPKAKSQI